MLLFVYESVTIPVPRRKEAAEMLEALQKASQIISEIRYIHHSDHTTPVINQPSQFTQNWGWRGGISTVQYSVTIEER